MMAKITALTIQKRDKQRCNLYIDEEFCSGISLETVYKHGLKVGLEVNETEIKELIYEGEKSFALEKAINYISKTIKTKKQVKTYLLGKGYSEEICFYCIDKLKEYGYIDDVEYSKKYIESIKNQGKKLSDYRLMMKGIRKEDIEKARVNMPDTEKENAKNLAEKYMKNKEITKENVMKTYRYLLGRGFSYESCEYAISFINGED